MKQETIRSLVGSLLAAIIGLGVGVAGSQGGYKVAGTPIYLICIGLAFLMQWVVFIPSYLNKTEKYYDLTGSITYISVTFLALLLTPVRDVRSLLVFALVVIWAARLGTFLFKRVKAAGEDRRFREIKKSFPRFLVAWTLQGLWVTFSLAGVLAVITSKTRVDFGVFAGLGLLIWLTGFGIEVIADSQKSRFKANPENEGRFIRTGLWSWSRHPNYFGEIVLWIGMLIIALPVLRGWQWVSLISPIFIIILLTRISGVPMLEKRADEKWGGEPEYEMYKAQTSVLIPFPPSKKT